MFEAHVSGRGSLIKLSSRDDQVFLVANFYLGSSCQEIPRVPSRKIGSISLSFA